MMNPINKNELQIDWLRIKNDGNGNPRYVCHYLNFLRPTEKGYETALYNARKLGGRKFHNKQYGGGIAFQAYNLHELENHINQLLQGK